tara:strand:+ start:285 stop:389 length:105 start_codon:yes stop_codon:yes gene_type:complete
VVWSVLTDQKRMMTVIYKTALEIIMEQPLAEGLV